MEQPLVRPGKVDAAGPVPRVVAYFYNSAQGNMVIQHVVKIGVSSSGIGVTIPDRLSNGQGMVLSIPCPDIKTQHRVEAICRAQGAEIQTQRG